MTRLQRTALTIGFVATYSNDMPPCPKTPQQLGKLVVGFFLHLVLPGSDVEHASSCLRNDMLICPAKKESGVNHFCLASLSGVTHCRPK